MDNFILVPLAAVVAGAVAFAAGYLIKQRGGAAADAESARLAEQAKAEAERIVEEAKAKQKELLLEAKEQAVSIKAAAEQDVRERRAEVQKREQRLQQREESFERKAENLEKRDRSLQLLLGRVLADRARSGTTQIQELPRRC